jgi:predicted transposase/invertase (TIGR01784 family)
MPLAPLNNQVVFKKLFQDTEVIKAFVKDVIGIDITPTTIEVEKQFTPTIGNVKVQIDVFVEDPLNRIVLEIQRVRYDYHYDRFLYYHYATTLDMVKNHTTYKLGRTVYTIVWLTSRSNDPLFQHGVVTTTLHSVTDKGKVLAIYPHTIYFLNPHYMSDETPAGIADWMQLVQASISEPPQPKIASQREIIQRAAALINDDGLTIEERTHMIEENDYEIHLQLKYNEGEKRGKLEGKLETARNMLAKGYPPIDIVELTGLSLDNLAALA